MTTYESICEKLGFRLEDYRPQISKTEDDSLESPFKKLTGEELDYVIQYSKQNNIGI